MFEQESNSWALHNKTSHPLSPTDPTESIFDMTVNTCQKPCQKLLVSKT